MDEISRNYLVSKAQVLRNLTSSDVPFLETLVAKTVEDSMELQGMMAPLIARRDALTVEDFNPVIKMRRLTTAITHIEVLLSMLQQRKEILSCGLKNLRTSLSELDNVFHSLRNIPIAEGEEDPVLDP